MPQTGIFLTARCSTQADARRLQRRARNHELIRIHKGVYVEARTEEELNPKVRSNWQEIAGAIAPGAVVSNLSAMTGGVLPDNTVYLSHPTLHRKQIALPGLTLVLLQGPGPLPGDFPLGSTGLYWAGRSRFLLENIGKKAPSRAGRDAVEVMLVNMLNASGEPALNVIRDEIAALEHPLNAVKQVATLRSMIGAMLGTHAKGELRTRDGQLVARGIPADQERLRRFEKLASYLRTVALPRIENRIPAGLPRHHAAFLESYFSNYVEGTKFDIQQARNIVMNNEVILSRPKDSHDILGVFRLATTAAYRDNPPVSGASFLEGLQMWHAEMLRMRPEVNPGKTKLAVNFAGTTQFVLPQHVRGTMEAGSRLALSVPEGFARALFYGFLISEVHPFEDGNGRISRLVMNAELTRVGQSRIIIPTLFHPQYVDCLRLLSRTDECAPFVASIVKAARWCSQFDYTDLDALIPELKKTNALEESPVQYQLRNLDGSLA